MIHIIKMREVGDETMKMPFIPKAKHQPKGHERPYKFQSNKRKLKTF